MNAKTTSVIVLLSMLLFAGISVVKATSPITVPSYRTMFGWFAWVDGLWLYTSIPTSAITTDYTLTGNVLQTAIPSMYGAPGTLDYTYDSKANLWITHEDIVVDLRYYCGCFVTVCFRGYLNFSGEPSAETFEHSVLYQWTYVDAPQSGQLPYPYGNVWSFWANTQWDSTVGAWLTQFTIYYNDKTETSYPNPIPLPSPLPEPILSITAPDDVTVEGKTIGGATGVALGNAVASGGVSPLTITNDAPSLFPLGDTAVTWTATDASGNSASNTQSITVQDTTPPTIEVVGSVSVVVGAPSSVLPVPTVVTDIVDSSPAVTNDASANFPAGITAVTWTATDHSGNSATATTTVTAHYNFIGFLSPLVTKGTFKAGTTIPVKFQLTDYYGNYVSTTVAKISVDGKDASSSGNSNYLNYFVYDLTASRYIFNLSTKGMVKGTHTIAVTLDDGTVHTIDINIILK